MSAHIQLSATLGTESTIIDTSGPKSSVTSSEPSEDSYTSNDSETSETVFCEVKWKIYLKRKPHHPWVVFMRDLHKDLRIHILQEVGSDSSDEDDIPLVNLASINNSNDSASNVLLSKLRNA